jgi:hypothetical protein
MSNATQYQFDLLEVAKLLMKQQGITEGRWAIGVGFNVMAGHAGPSPEAARPSMIVSVDKINIGRADENTPDSMVVDAKSIS